MIIRHQGDINALTGDVVEQVIDEFNRPAQADYGAARSFTYMPCSVIDGARYTRRVRRFQ